MKKTGPLLLVLVLLFAIPDLSTSADEKAMAPSSGTGEGAGESFNLGERLISFYSRNISAVDGDRCPSYPSCGSYSAQAFRKHGFIMGWLMTVDRLIHEGKEETKVSPFIYSEGKWKIYDPVENNDFWWYSKDEKTHE